MHYSALAGSSNGKPTIVPLSPLEPNVEMGQRIKGSETDYELINRMYNCPTQSAKGTQENEPAM